MEIRLANTEDLDEIMEIYKIARQFMKDHGNERQWGIRQWPPRDLIEKDIAERKSYVCTQEDEIVGVFYYDYGKDVEPTYLNIEGEWKDPSPYGVVHRIASKQNVKGVGTFCISYAFDKCRHLRIDTHADNYVMQNLLKKLGFTYCGIIYVYEDHDPRYAYEKN